jgi:charged multivesicular body protein 3
MMKAGLIEEMMNDALDSALDTEEMEEETEEQIQRVLAEIVGETSAALPQAQKNKVPARGKQQESQKEPDEIEEGSEMAEMRRRLEAIRS